MSNTMFLGNGISSMKLINMQILVQYVTILEKHIALLLPAFHSITGCDTTSYFFRAGKCRIFKKVVKEEWKLGLLGSFGQKVELTTMIINK